MARYIVIEVSDNQAAENLIESIHSQTKKGWPFRLVGVFVKPGKTCSCWNWGKSNYRENKAKVAFAGGVERGAKFGWWVCTECNKPRKAGHSLVNQILPSQTYIEQDTHDDEWEFTIDGLSVGSIHRQNIDRPKKLRKKRK